MAVAPFDLPLPQEVDTAREIRAADRICFMCRRAGVKVNSYQDDRRCTIGVPFAACYIRKRVRVLRERLKCVNSFYAT